MAGTPSTGFATNTFSIDASARYQVIAQTYCRRILVQENFNSASAPTADLKMAQPAGATLVNVSKGTSAIFTPTGDGRFSPNQIVGEIQTASGSCTVLQIESATV